MLLTLLTTVLAGSGLAGAKDIELGAAWVRPTPPTIDRTAAYFHVRNTGPQDEDIVAVSSTIARVTEFHTMQTSEGMMVMRPLPLPIPVMAGGGVDFRPGGHHLMLIDLVTPLSKGDRVPFTLWFSRSGEITVEAVVSDTPPMGDGHEMDPEGH